jgi:hypothetical protein
MCSTYQNTEMKIEQIDGMRNKTLIEYLSIMNGEKYQLLHVVS